MHHRRATRALAPRHTPRPRGGAAPRRCPHPVVPPRTRGIKGFGAPSGSATTAARPRRPNSRWLSCAGRTACCRWGLERERGGIGSPAAEDAARAPADAFPLLALSQANPVPTPANRAAIVEALRRVAELVAWGDARDPAVVDHFLEAKVLASLTSLARTPTGRAPPVGTQLLQTLAMLVGNLKSPPASFYLFSGGALDAVLRAPFDLGADDELLGHYVGLLKGGWRVGVEGGWRRERLPAAPPTPPSRSPPVSRRRPPGRRHRAMLLPRRRRL